MSKIGPVKPSGTFAPLTSRRSTSVFLLLTTFGCSAHAADVGKPPAASGNGAASAATQGAESVIDKVSRLFAAGDYKRALDLISGDRWADDAAAAYWRGRIHQVRQEFNQARSAYRRAMELKPKYLDPHLALGKLAADLGDLDLAVTELEAAGKLAGNTLISAEITSRLRDVYHQRSTTLYDGLPKDKGLIDPAIELGQKLVRANMLDEAQRLFERVLEQTQDNPQPYYWLGRIYLSKHQEGKGISAMERSVSLAPENPLLRLELAKAYESIGRFENAEVEYRKVLETKGTPAVTVVETERRLQLILARKEVLKGDVASALQRYQELLKTTPEDPGLLELYARALERLNHTAEADQVYARLRKLLPQDAGLRLRLAEVYRIRGDEARVREAFVEAYKLTDDAQLQKLALDGLGLRAGDELILKGDYKAANKIFFQIDKELPHNPDIMMRKAKIYSKLGLDDRAVKVYGEILKLAPGRKDALLRRAESHLALGRDDKAVPELEELARLGKDVPEARAAADLLKSYYQKRAESLAAEISTGSGFGAKDVDGAVDLAQKLIAVGMAASAQQILVPLTQHFPDARAFYWLGQTEINTGDRAKGLGDLEKSVALAPDNGRLFLSIGKLHEDAGHWAEAESAYKKASETVTDKIGRDEADKRLNLVQAQRFLLDSKPEEAAKLLATLGKRYPDEERVLTLQSEALLSSGHKDEAIALLEKVVELSPRNVILRLKLASIYYNDKQYDKAEQIDKQLLKLQPQNLSIHLALADLYKKQGRFVDAADQVKEILKNEKLGENDRKNGEKFLNDIKQDMVDQGRKLLDGGELDEAQSLFEGLLRIDPDQAPAHYWLAQVYKARKSFDNEVSALEKSLTLAPENLLLVPALANAYVEAGKLEKAAEILNKLLVKRPFDFPSRSLLVTVYDKLGQQDKADDEAKIILEQGAPDEIRTKALDRMGMEAGRNLFKEEKYQEALIEYGKVLKIVPTEPVANEEIARVYMALENYDAAIAAYRTAIQEAPDKAEDHIQLARAYLKAENDEAAINEARLVTSMMVAKNWKDQAKTILASIQERQANKILDEEDLGKLADKGEGKLFPLMQRMLDDELYQSVRNVAEKVIAERPDLITPYRLMGRALIGLKRPTDAVVLLKQALVGHPGNTDIQLVLADAYREAKSEKLAASVYEDILREDPSAAAVALALAELYHDDGDEEHARESYAKVLSVARIPKLRKQALAGLGLSDVDRLIQQSQWQDAGDQVTALVRLAPNVPEILLRQVRILVGTKRIELAKAEYRRVVELDDNLSEARFALGTLLADEGHVDEAITELEIVARKGPSDPYSRRAIDSLGKIFAAKSAATVAELASAESLTPPLETRALDLIKDLYLRLYYAHVKEISEAMLKHGANAQAYYWLGQAALKLGDHAKGVEAIEQSAALSADNSAVLMRLAEVYESSGDLKKAEAAYRRATALIPSGPAHEKAKERMLVNRARVLDSEGHIEEALKIYDGLLLRAPNDVQLLGLQGKALLALGRSDEADRAFERLATLEPNNVRIRLRMAQLYHEKGRDAQTLIHVKAILAIQPSGPDALAALTLIGFDKAVELQTKQDWPKALEAYDQLLKVIPNNPMVLERIAAIYQQTNDLSNLEKTLHAILAVEPANGEALWRLSRLYLQTKRNDQAISTLEDYLNHNRKGKYAKQVVKELADLYRARVSVLAQARKYDEAAMVLKKFARENPDNGRAFLQLGLFYAYSGEYDQAIAALQEAARLMPDDPSVFHQLAVTYAQDSKALDAVTAYAREISLQEDPDKAMAVVKDLLFMMARKYYEEDQPILSIRYLERLRGLGFKDSRIQNMLGFLDSQQGDYDQAIEVYREGIGINPDDLSMHFSLAGLYEQTNATAAAIAQLREILKRGKAGDRYVEAARQRKRYLEDKERRFTSNLGYTLISGKSVIQEQDVNNTGAVNTSFSSSFNYRLTTTFHPSEKTNIAIVTGLTHSANHSAENDSIAPNISFNANVNNPKSFWGFSAGYTESYGLLLDQYGGASANATVSNGLRFNHPISEFMSLFDFSEDPLPDYFLSEDKIAREDISLETKEEDKLRDYLTDVPITNLPAGRSVRDVRTFFLHVLADLMHGHPDAALERLKEDPYRIEGHDLALLLRGWLAEKLGRPADATSLYLSLLERDSSNLWAKYSLGRLYQTAKDPEALNWLEAVYRATGPADALHELGGLRLRMAFLADAAQLLAKSMRKDDHAQFYGLIDRLYGLQAYSDTLPLLEQRADSDRRDFAAHLWAGRFALALGRYKAAEGYLEDAVDLDGSSAFAHRALADAYLAQGKLDDADEAYAWVVAHSGDEEQRIYALEQLPLGIKPDDMDAEDREKRAQELASYLQAHPDDPATLIQLADMEMLLGRNEQALERYRKAGTLRPQDKYVSWRLIEAKPKEDGEQYRASLRSLMSLSDDHWFHLRVLRHLKLFEIVDLLADDDFDNAKDLLEQAHDVLDDDSLINLNLALVYRRLNDGAKAKGVLESMIETHPENLTALWMLGDLNISLRSLDKGMTELEQVAAQGGDSRIARLAREKLHQLEEERFAFLTKTPEESVASTKTFSTSISMGKSFPVQSYLAQTRDASLTFSLSLPSVTWGTVTLGYTYAKKYNEDPLGTDYANHSQRVNLSYNRPVPGVPKLTGAFSISYQQTDHEYNDTNAFYALGIVSKRRITNDALSANLSYQLADNLSLSWVYSQSKTRANLPVGIVYTPSGTRFAFQSAALGSFETSSMNMTLNFRF